MKRTFAFISVFALMLTMLALPAAADSHSPHTGMPGENCYDEITYEGETYTAGEDDKTDDPDGDIDLGDGVSINVDGDTVTASGGTVILCIKGGNTNSGTLVLEDGDSVDYRAMTGHGISNIVVYHVIPDEPLTTEALLTGVKYEDALPPDGETIEGWGISILEWDEEANGWVLSESTAEFPNPTTTDAEGAWQYQTPTVEVDDEADTITYAVCEEQRDGWTQLYPVFNGNDSPQEHIQIDGFGTCHLVEVGVDDEQLGPFDFVNEVTPGDVNITKVDQNGDPLSGITFSLNRTVDDVVQYHDTCTTDAAGECSFDDVPVGDGYVLDESGGYALGEVHMDGELLPNGLPHTFDVEMGDAPATGSSYTFTVVNIVPGGEWCSPGFWRNNPGAWEATGYHPDNDYNTIFGADLEGDPSLWEVLQSPQTYGGDAFNNVGDLLSGSHPDVDFDGERVEDSCPLSADSSQGGQTGPGKGGPKAR